MQIKCCAISLSKCLRYNLTRATNEIAPEIIRFVKNHSQSEYSRNNKSKVP